MSPQILVTGAGVTGGEVLRQLAAVNVPARALVRNLDRAEPFKKIGVELIEGDFAQPDSWKRALEGVSKVFAITLSHPDAEAWNATLLDVAKQSGIKQFVQLSGTNVSSSSPAKFHRQMGRCDDAVKASGLEYTVLQANVFYPNMMREVMAIRERGRFRSAIGDARISMIDVRDIAEVAAIVLTGDGHLGKVYGLTGPESLTYFDVASLLSEAVGKPIEYEVLDEDTAVKALIGIGMPEPRAKQVVEIHRSFSNGALTAVTDDVQNLLGRPPRPFAEFARDYATSFR